MVALELLGVSQAHGARKAELTVRLPGAKIAPTSSTCARGQTLRQNSSANGARSCIIAVGRVCIVASLGRLETSIPYYPFTTQMDKVEPTVP